MTVNLDNLKFQKHLSSGFKIICSFGKVDQNIKKKRQQKHLNVLSHPVPFSCERIKPSPLSLETRLI